MKSFCYIFILALCALSIHSALAQELEVVYEEQPDAITDPNTYSDGFSGELIQIQEQNALIASLIERQAQIAKLASHYENMGVAYTQPKPDLSICERLPQNLLCLLHYPELDNNKEATEAIRASLLATIQENMRNALESYVLYDNASDSANMIQSLIFEWDDIQCLQGKCTALLIPKGYENRRYRVEEGDKLANNIKVSSITPTDVIIIQNSQKITLKPTSFMTASTTSFEDNSVGSNQSLIDVLDNNPADDIPVQPFTSGSERNVTPEISTSVPATTNTSVIQAPATDAPMLGPTGLF